MTDPNLNIDPSLLAEFIDESLDMLSGLDSMFVRLETDPQDLSTVEAIFRPAHSIKGNSSFFGFTKVKMLAHEMETLLDLVRKKKLAVTKPVIDVLLEGVDELKAMLERGRNREPEVVAPGEFDALVGRVKAAATGQGPSGPEALKDALFKLGSVKDEFEGKVDGLGRELDSVAALLRRLLPDEAPPATGVWGRAPAAARGIKDILAKPVEDQLPEDQSADVGKALAQLRGLAGDDQARAMAEDLLDTYETFVATVGFDALLQEVLLEKLETLVAHGSWSAEFPGAPPPAEKAGTSTEAAAPPPAGAERVQPETHKTMRISEGHIDTFLAYVGELVVVGDMFNHLQKEVSEGVGNAAIVSSFRRTNETFATLSNNLQQSIMSIRKVSVRSLLQKVPRMVRDIAKNTGKEIAAKLEGEDVEVDKSLIDLLDAPLTHMVRNAADHGVERPDERLAAGKGREGTVRVAVSETPDNIIMVVEDDGAGLKYDAIRRKAEALGIVRPGQQLREDDVLRFIFSSGVSTAEVVTDVSGRGVGMDVVRRMIEDAGGSVKVTSTPGKGSQFTVQVPKTVTTQIMPGFLVEVNGQCYVLPLENVHETTKVSKDAVNSVTGKGQCVTLHDKILPVFSLRETLGLPAAADNGREEEVMVTVEAFKRQLAMVVDDVLGVQKVVLRQIEGLEVRSQAVAGGALMGDGSVALIVDVERLCDRRGRA